MVARSRMLPVLMLSLAGAALPAVAGYMNTTAGGKLRPGVYGHIEVGQSAPPPVIHSEPVVASRAVLPNNVRPIYLYVPPGQMRKWPSHCAKYQACNLPVYFVRVDDSPSKLGRWKQRGDPAAGAGGLARPEH